MQKACPVLSVVSPAMGHWGTSPSTCNSFIFSLLWSNFESKANYPSIV